MPENEYLIGQANHHNPCLGRTLNIRQLIDPWPSSVLSVIGLGAHSGLTMFGFWGELQNPGQGHSVALLCPW